MHFRFGLDPENDRKGRSPLAGVLREVFTDDEAANYTASLLRNMGVPGIIVSRRGGRRANRRGRSRRHEGLPHDRFHRRPPRRALRQHRSHARLAVRVFARAANASRPAASTRGTSLRRRLGIPADRRRPRRRPSALDVYQHGRGARSGLRGRDYPDAAHSRRGRPLPASRPSSRAILTSGSSSTFDLSKVRVLAGGPLPPGSALRPRRFGAAGRRSSRAVRAIGLRSTDADRIYLRQGQLRRSARRRRRRPSARAGSSTERKRCRRRNGARRRRNRRRGRATSSSGARLAIPTREADVKLTRRSERRHRTTVGDSARKQLADDASTYSRWKPAATSSAATRSRRGSPTAPATAAT